MADTKFDQKGQFKTMSEGNDRMKNSLLTIDNRYDTILMLAKITLLITS